MSVVDVTQMWSRDGGSQFGQKNDRQFRGFTRTTAYQVLVDDVDTHIDDIENASGIPAIGDLYPDSEIVRVIRKVPKRHSPIFWEVDIEYEGDNTLNLNKPIITKGSVTSSEPLDSDWFGRAITNVNGEVIEGLSRDLSDTVITITRNFLEVNDDLVLDYLESTNSDTWGSTGLVGPYAPGRVRMTSYNATQVFANESTTVGYWKVTAQFQARRGYADTPPEKSWFKRYRNEGLKILDDAGFLRRAPDENGAPSSKPVLLKSDGTLEPTPENAIFLYSQVYGSMPYNSLGLL